VVALELGFGPMVHCMKSIQIQTDLWRGWYQFSSSHVTLTLHAGGHAMTCFHVASADADFRLSLGMILSTVSG